MSKKPQDDLVLTEELLRISSGQYDVGLITTAVLMELGLKSLFNGLERCSSLTSLNLSGNRLLSIEGIEHCSATLQFLDLSNNSISRLDLLVQFKKLEVLKAQPNNVESLDALGSMSSSTMPALRAIYFQSKDRQQTNPLCQCNMDDYVKAVNERFPKIRCLDGHYFLKDQANPMFVDAGDDREIKLPASVPWVSEESLKCLVTDPSKAGLITEKAFYALAADSKKLVATTVKK